VCVSVLCVMCVCVCVCLLCCVCDNTSNNTNDVTLCYRAGQIRPTGGPHNSLRTHLRAALVYEGEGD